MNAEQWKPIAARIIRRWPHVDWEGYAADGVIDQLLTDLIDLDADHVAAAVEALSRDGLRFPPLAGEIRAKIVELGFDAPDWGEAALAIQKLAGYPTRRFSGGEFHDDRAAKLAEAHPVLQAFIAHVGWQEAQHACSLDRTAEAQTRERYLAFVRRRQRDSAYHGLPSAGLRALERVNSEPRQLGAAVLALVEQGEDNDTTEAA